MHSKLLVVDPVDQPRARQFIRRAEAVLTIACLSSRLALVFVEGDGEQPGSGGNDVTRMEWQVCQRLRVTRSSVDFKAKFPSFPYFPSPFASEGFAHKIFGGLLSILCVVSVCVM